VSRLPFWIAALSFATGSRQDPRPPERPALPTPEEIAQLPPDGGPRFNRLVFEKSPYLLQHAANPVDWWPWGEAALERARAQDKPVFLSIGYATCHWCHVMEHESFEDAEVARVLNAGFVCIKVDREERPDVDHVYMSATQALTGSGGWPLTLILFPDGRPFFAATYIPKEPRFGRPGLVELLERVRELWTSDREALAEDARRITEHLAKTSLGSPGELPGRAALDAASRQLAQGYDAAHGGFGQAPKFPVPHQLLFLFQHAERTGDARAREMALETLAAMRRGGIWDHVGYGFHRYSTDREWLVPHFEKMLYDQALLALAYVAGWQVSGRGELRRTAEQIFEYVLRDLREPGGAFASAEDADSEGEEGRFYTWTVEELRAALGEERSKLAETVFGVTREGHLEGRSVLHLTAAPEELAKTLGLEPANLAQRVEAIRTRLFAAREARPRPLKDDKVLADWNGLMIAALARAAAAFDSPEHARAAGRAAEFVLAHLADERGRLKKRWRDGQAALPGTLEDHAFLAWGLLELYQATFDPRWLERAKQLADAMVAHFHDAERGGFYLTADDGAKLVLRAKDSYDGALPSGNSAAALALLQLARITGEPRYEELAAGTLKAFAGDLAAAPASHTFMLLGLDFALGPAFEIVIAGDPSALDTQALLLTARTSYRPAQVLLLRPPGDAPITALAPWIEPHAPLDGRAAAYVCRDFACRAPTTSPDELAASLSPRLPAK